MVEVGASWEGSRQPFFLRSLAVGAVITSRKLYIYIRGRVFLFRDFRFILQGHVDGGTKIQIMIDIEADGCRSVLLRR